MEKHVLNKLATPGHPNIVKLHGTFTDSSNVYLLLDFFKEGELWEETWRTGCVDLPRAKYFIKQLVEAVAYLHSQDIVHRDLKCENLMLYTPPENPQSKRLVVIDFGTALDLNRPDLTGAGNGAGTITRRTFLNYVGTPNFMPPETIKNKFSGKSQDIYAVGATIFQILSGQPPFKSATEYLTLQAVQNGHLEFPSGFPEEAKDLCRILMSHNPSDRPSEVNWVLGHPFLLDALDSDQTIPPMSDVHKSLKMLTANAFPEVVCSRDQQQEIFDKLQSGIQDNASNPTGATFNSQIHLDLFKRVRKVLLREAADKIDSQEMYSTIWNALIPGREHHELLRNEAEAKKHLEMPPPNATERKADIEYMPEWMVQMTAAGCAWWVSDTGSRKANWILEGIEDGMIEALDALKFDDNAESDNDEDEQIEELEKEKEELETNNLPSI